MEGVGMIVVWRGLGILVPVIGIAVWLVCEFTVDAALGDGYYRGNSWPMYCTLGLVSVALGAMGYVLNHRLRNDIEDPETGAILGKPPSHSLFFLPIEYWAILIPVVALWSQSSAAKQDQQDAKYLEAPISGDVYVTDFSETFDDIDQQHKWGVLRVHRVRDYNVHVKIGSMGYGLPLGAFKAVQDGEDQAPGYYVHEMISLRRDELQGLKETGVINEVVRTVGARAFARAD